MKRNPSKLGTIRDEKAACIAAWRKHPKAMFAWFCHHEEIIEGVEGLKGAMERIGYIERDKPGYEKAERYRNFRPVTRRVTARLIKADKAVNKFDRITKGLTLSQYDRYRSAQDAFCREVERLSSPRIHNKDWPNNTAKGYRLFR